MTLSANLVSLANAREDSEITDLRSIEPIHSECQDALKSKLIPLLDSVLAVLPALGRLNDALGDAAFKQILNYIMTHTQSNIVTQYLAVVGYTIVGKKEPTLDYYKDFISDLVSITIDQVCYLIIENPSNLLPSPVS